MTLIKTTRRSKPGAHLVGLLIFAAFGAAAYWALTTLFPAELHQIAQWLLARFNALLK